MTSVAQINIFPDTFCDFSTSFSWISAGIPTDLTGYTAAMMVKLTPADTLPLLSISTTPNAQGSVVLVDGPLAGTATVSANSVAVAFSNSQSLPPASFLRFSTQPGVLYPVVSQTTLSMSATLATPYSGSPSSSAVATLVTGSVEINLTLAGMTTLVGVPESLYDVVLTSSTGVPTKFLSGHVLTDQTVTH